MNNEDSEINLILERAIWQKMRGGAAGLRKKNDRSRHWFEDKECEKVRNGVLGDRRKLKAELHDINEAISQITHGPDLAHKIPVKLNEAFIYGAVHRRCLELIRKKEAAGLPPAPKQDATKDLAHFLKSNGVEWLLSDWIFSNRSDAVNKRHKDLRGLRYVAKRLPGLPHEVHRDIYADAILQLCESLRSGLWRGEHGAASILNYFDRTIAGIRAEYFEWENQQLDHRSFDSTQPGQKGAEYKVMAGPGREDPKERKSDPYGPGFWTKAKGFEDEDDKLALEVFRTNHPKHFTETLNRTFGTDEVHEDHWLDNLRGHDLKPCLFSGMPAPVVEDEKFEQWQLSIYWQDPEKRYEKKDLYERAFDSSKFDPNKSYRENLRQAKKDKTLRFIGILQQKFGEDWDDKEIADFWASAFGLVKYEKREKDNYIKYIESFGLKYLGDRISPDEIKTDLVKGIIRRQKNLVRADLKKLGYLRPPHFRFPDRTSKLFYSPIKRSDKEKREPEIPRIGEYYFKGKIHFRPGFSS